MLNLLRPAVLTGILALGGTGAVAASERPAPPTSVASAPSTDTGVRGRAPTRPKGRALGKSKERDRAEAKARGHHKGPRGAHAPGRVRSHTVRQRNLVRMAERLDLTEAQSATIKKITAETRKKIVEARAKGKARIQAVLTPEQRKELASMKADKNTERSKKMRRPRATPNSSS